MYEPISKIPQDSIESRMLRELSALLDDQVKKVTEKIIADAQEKFASEMRGKLVSIAINLANYYSVERSGGNLVITVKIEGLKS
jgi:hypothetical protein